MVKGGYVLYPPFFILRESEWRRWPWNVVGQDKIFENKFGL